MTTILEKISLWVNIEFDAETKQYTLINHETPWVYGVWDTKEEAIKEYLSCLWDLILVNNSRNYETKTFA